MSRAFPWNVLGIDATRDRAAIRKAYADTLRGLNVDEDIAGYANLRRARDEALWLAAQGEQADDEGDYGLGSLDDEDADLAFDDGDDWYDAPDTSPPEALHDAPAAELTEAQAKAQTAWQALLDILYPGGEVSEESVTYDEMEAGLAHLAVLLDHAERADLAEHDALDGALADVFARTWPRSAPFVEPANAALHWLDEAGKLEERPALMFLNQRLKGMRFHDKVQQPDHPLHKAWMELSRPGRARFIDRLKVKRLDVDKLLTGVRTHYPELESHLAPDRVASWEGDTNESGVSETGPKAVRWVFVAVLIGSALARLGSNLSEPRNDDQQATFAEGVEAVGTIEADIAVADIFGEGVGMAEVRAADPVFADQLRDALDGTAYGGRFPLALTRRKALEAGEVAEFDALVARAELRRLWLTVAKRQGDGMCQKVMQFDFADRPLAMGDLERARERKLLRKLLEAKVLSHDMQQRATQFAIPGWVVSAMINRSGLTEDALRAAMQDTASYDRCTAEIALMDVVLQDPARVPEEVLRGI
jgi:hypothetical protein